MSIKYLLSRDVSCAGYGDQVLVQYQEQGHRQEPLTLLEEKKGAAREVQGASRKVQGAARKVQGAARKVQGAARDVKDAAKGVLGEDSN